MFKVGDYVVYGNSGVCRVEDIGPISIGSKDKDYYTLVPVYGRNSRLYTVVNSDKVVIRPIMTKQESDALIDEMNKQLSTIEKYNNTIKSKTVKYLADRNKAIRKQAEEEAKAAREQAKFEAMYGYTGDKKSNYDKRLQTAIDFYTSLPKEAAIKLVNNNPTIAGYLGHYYSRLVSAVSDM